MEEDIKLKLEEPKTVTFKITNLSGFNMKLLLSAKEREANELKITHISQPNLGSLDPYHSLEFSLDLFPTTCGVHRLGGLIIKEVTRNLRYEFNDLAEFLVSY